MHRILLHSNLNNAKWIIIANKLYVYAMINLVGYRYCLSIKENVFQGKGNKMKEHKSLTVEDIQCQYV